MMRARGFGLRPLITLNLVVILGVLAALLAYTAIYLTRHGLTRQEVDHAKNKLKQIAFELQKKCPHLIEQKKCPGLAQFVQEKKADVGLVVLSVYDSEGKLVVSSDYKVTADSLWGVFADSQSDQPPSADWWLWEKEAGRLLVIKKSDFLENWSIQGAFSLDPVDSMTVWVANNLLLYSILLFGVMLLVGFVLLRRLIIKPMERLLSSVDRVSEGDLDFLLHADRGSEMGRLGFSLSRMARRIEEDQQRLKDQIAELQRLNSELHQAQLGLIRSEKLASVGKLAAGVAHEVGNPMSAILGYVSMMRTEDIPKEDEADILARVETEVERIDKVIKDLLVYSRPSKGEWSLVDPAELLEDSMALIRPQKKYKQVELKIELDDQLPLVNTDPDLVRQVLVNLLLNALDAVDEGGHIWFRAVELNYSADGELSYPNHPKTPEFFELGPIHQIKLPKGGKSIQLSKKAVVFTVVDDGCGIQPKDLTSIFDPFFTTKEPGAGTGLGLAICHSAITSLEGEIWVYSQPGEGTQFAFFLPVE
jgi:signal transduction histidine kinase